MGRWYERLGILMAFTIGVTGMVLAQLGLNYQSGLPFRLTQLTTLDSLALFAVACFTVSLLLGRFRPNCDPLLLPLVTLLGMLSLIFINRLPIVTTLPPETFSTARIHTCYGNKCQNALFVTESQGLTQSQSEKFALGLVALSLITFWSLPLRSWQRYRSLMLLIGFILLLITAFFGRESSPGGPRLSLDLGLFDLQPAELVKLLLVGYVAGYLSSTPELRRPRSIGKLPIPPLRYLLPLGVVLGVAGFLLVLMADLGAALIVLGIFPVLCYIGIPERTTKLWLGLIMMAVILLSLALLGSVATTNNCPLPGLGVVCRRIEAWRDPFAVAEAGGSTQQLSGIYALGAGGVWGRGLGLGLPKGVVVPVIESDMIYVGIAEDLGVIGVALLLGVYTLLLWRGIVIARNQSELYPKLLAGGIVALFGTQLFVIVGGILGLIPLTGIPLPLVSAGGSAVILNLVAVGILLRLSAVHPVATPDLTSNQRLLHVGYLYSALVVLLLLGSLYWMVIRAGSLDPASTDFIVSATNSPAIQRLQAWAQQGVRGSILTFDGVPLAVTTVTGRTITASTMADILGTMVPDTQIGATGLEAAFNDTLLGKGSWDPATLIAQRFGGNWRGYDVRLTIDSTWQAAAASALEGYHGAVVVVDANTGAIRAVVSYPLLSESGDGESYRNRAFQNTYPPGSTFKTMVAAAALEANLASLDGIYRYPDSEWDLSGTMPCHYRTYAGYTLPSCNTPRMLTAMTFMEGYYWSDNVMFADLALTLGPSRLQDSADRFGFGLAPPLEVPTLPSVLTTAPTTLELTERLAFTGIGQQDVRATPLQMALIPAAILNNGQMPTPHLVSAILTANGDIVQETTLEPWRTALDPTTASQMVDLMVLSAEAGWASGAAIPGITLGGKTGTAEWGDNTIGTRVGAQPHSWYHGFAILPTGERVAFAVIVEAGGEGSGAAAGVVRGMLETIILQE